MSSQFFLARNAKPSLPCRSVYRQTRSPHLAHSSVSKQLLPRGSSNGFFSPISRNISSGIDMTLLTRVSDFGGNILWRYALFALGNKRRVELLPKNSSFSRTY
jgi:hypothetical protein